MNPWKLRTPLLVAAVVAAATACSNATRIPETVIASASSEGMVLVDRTSFAVNFVAMSEKSAPLVEWAPLAVPRIAPGTSITVPRADILGFAEGGGPVVVYWWGVRPASGGGYELVPNVSGTLHVSGL